MGGATRGLGSTHWRRPGSEVSLELLGTHENFRIVHGLACSFEFSPKVGNGLCLRGCLHQVAIRHERVVYLRSQSLELLLLLLEFQGSESSALSYNVHP